jgi:hypothetical protein
MENVYILLVLITDVYHKALLKRRYPIKWFRCIPPAGTVLVFRLEMYTLAHNLQPANS